MNEQKVLVNIDKIAQLVGRLDKVYLELIGLVDRKIYDELGEISDCLNKFYDCNFIYDDKGNVISDGK